MPEGGEDEHHGAGEDDERLRADGEGDGVGRADPARDQDGRAGSRLRGGPGRRDREGARGGRGTEKGDRERQREGEAERVQEEEEPERPRQPGGEDEQPGLPGVPRGNDPVAEPACDPEAKQAPAGGQPRQDRDDDRGAEAREGDDGQGRAHRAGGVRRGGRGAGERHQRRRVEQPEHEEGETDGPDTRAPVGGPTDDGDPDDVVEAPGQRRAGHGGGAARGPEGERLRPLVRGEEPVPAVRLEGEGQEEESARGHDQADVRARERPADAGEVPRREHRDRDREEADSDVQRQLPLRGPAQVEKPSHRVCHRPGRGRSQPADGVRVAYSMW